jgi:hypothetical protein
MAQIPDVVLVAYFIRGECSFVPHNDLSFFTSTLLHKMFGKTFLSISALLAVATAQSAPG